MYKAQYEKRRIPTETNKYKALLQAIEQGSITAAARELEYSPSGLTRVLDGLERELGLPLLQRSPQGVELTLEGQDLLPAIRELLYWAGQIQERSASLQGLEQGELAIGSYYSIASCWLPAILRDFQRDFPHIRIHVQEAGNRTLLQGLRERKLSCCLFNRNAGYQGDWIPLYQDRLVAWIPESHPLAKKKAIRPEDLDGQPFIDPLPHQGTDTALFLKKYHVQPDIRFTTSNMYTCWTMVEAGLGLSMDNALSSRGWNGAVRVLPFDTPDRLELGIALPSQQEASPALKKFIQYVKRTVEGLTRQSGIPFR